MWEGPTSRANRACGRGAMAGADVADVRSDLFEVVNEGKRNSPVVHGKPADTISYRYV
jgi:hypothetical protein